MERYNNKCLHMKESNVTETVAERDMFLHDKFDFAVGAIDII